MSKSVGHENIISSERRRLVEGLHASVRKNFPKRHIIVREYDDLWQADIVEMLPYSRFNRSHHYILTVIDVLSKYAVGRDIQEQSWKRDGRNYRPNNSREREMSEEFIDRYGKRVLQRRRATTRKETRYQSLFDVFGVKGIGRRTIQLHAEEQHVEDVYPPRKLQVDQRAAASRVRLRRAQAVERSTCDPSTSCPRSPKNS